jgi:hypothetical protein
MFKSILTVTVHAAFSNPCCMDMDIQTFSRDVGVQHGHRHAAWRGACTMDMGMQHEHGH